MSKGLVFLRRRNAFLLQWEHKYALHSTGWIRSPIVPSTEARMPGWNSRRNHATAKDCFQEAREGPFSRILRGTPIEFDNHRKIANLADSSILGKSGDTVVLTTVTTGTLPADRQIAPRNSLAAALERTCFRENPSEVSPMTVDYRQRHHAVGKIPTSSNRTDNQRATKEEILASRAIDRALRPLLRKDIDDSSIHVSCSIQSYLAKDNPQVSATGGGHPLSLALNAAALALKDRLVEPLAAVVLSLMKDGTVLVNPSMASIQQYQRQNTNKDTTTDDENRPVGELLFAGTRKSIVMIEFSGLLPEPLLLDLIHLAQKYIQPILETQEKVKNVPSNISEMNDEELKRQLGICVEELESDTDSNTSSSKGFAGDDIIQSKADQIRNEALEFVHSSLRDVVLRLFGAERTSSDTNRADSIGYIHVHSEETDTPLRSKQMRAKRETLVKAEVKRLLALFEPTNSELAKEYKKLIDEEKSVVVALENCIYSQILREGMKDASIAYKSRADGRGNLSHCGSHTIRPLSMEVPALPDTVHGSAIFTRGETQVLCTTTLGPPKDGILQNDPFDPVTESLDDNSTPNAPSKILPVGSLRYLRSQEHLESDLNSRKVLADREQTGDSGTLKERKRAFLQYDFPAFCNGEIPTGPSMASRREIGHGALAEKAILPILPPAREFPYAIRMTSEVTSSNGSSSMASICGTTLSLLDAGVPIISPAAGVSVGLVQDETTKSYQLLLDISGTEDHHGVMDFKVAGTADSVSAMQLDVKKPLPISLVAEALEIAKKGRIVILEEMKLQSETSSNGQIVDLLPRPELKHSAPKSSVVTFDPARKKDLLGPGGAVIRQMEDRFNVSLDLTQEGQCLLFGDDREMVRKAKSAVMDLVSDVEVGTTYEGTVIEIRDFGLIIELLRNKEGLCHVSEFATKDEIRKHPKGTLGMVNERFSIGQKIDVVCTAVDPVQGVIRLRLASTKERF